MPTRGTPHELDELDAAVISLYGEARYQEAIEPALSSVVLARQLFGERSPRFATSLNNLALLYVSIGKYQDAERIYRQAIEIDRIVLGEESPEYATSLDNLAELYVAMSNAIAAEPLCRQALEIRRAALGEQHPDFAVSLNSLAALHQSIGDYTAAERLYKQSVEIRRVALGERHPDYAVSLNNLGVLYYLTGDYAAAQPLLAESLRITESMSGEQHPDYATALNNIAMVYGSMGDYAVAEQLYDESLKIRRQVFGEQHPMVAAALDNLASVYYARGNYSAAEPLCKQSVDIYRDLGEQRLDLATSLSNLATLYCRMGDYSTAEAHYKHATQIYETVVGEQHPQFAMSLNNLAMCCAAMGEYSVAEQFYRRAIQVKRDVLDNEHPSLGTSLSNMASVLAAVGKTDQARTVMEEALKIDDRIIAQVFSISSERQRTVHLQTVRSQLDIFLSLVNQHLSDSPDAVRSALSVVLRRKGIEAEALAVQRDAILSGKYPELAPLVREATILRTQIAQTTLSGPGNEGAEAHRQMIVEWSTRKERVEMELARCIPELNLANKLRSVDQQVVTLALPDGAALIEFVRFNLFDFKALPARGQSHWRPERYLAFVILSEELDRTAMIDLGEAEPIDQMIATFRAAITNEEEGRGKRGLGRVPSHEQYDLAEDVGITLCQSVFSPLLNAVGGRKRLLIAPDGELSRLPFEVLPLDGQRRVIDDYRISYVGAGRDVIRFNSRSERMPGPSLVVADPDFDFESKVTCTDGGGRRSADFRRDQDGFNRLPGTRHEGERIGAMLGADLWVEGKALDGRLKRCRSPLILHVASHGFFLENQKHTPNQHPVEFASTSSDRGLQRLAGKRLESPLLRSGLALAGVNTWLKQGQLMEEAEDGLVTAEDVSGLDLLDTELVVLSACETGLGEVRIGEGVFGLRRSFVLAGAKTLVMSLWKVPDEQTRELMEDFYRRILAGEARADALRQAQLTIKAKYPEPFYWGAFICQGDPGPLTLDKQSFGGLQDESWAAIADESEDSLDAVLANRIEEVLSRGPFPKCGGCGIEPLKPLVLVSDKKQNRGYLCETCIDRYIHLLRPTSIRNFWMCGVCGYRVLAGTEIDATVDTSGNACPNCGVDVNASLVNLKGDRPVVRGLLGEPIEE